jgi:zinc transport system substrate-binding protein
MNLCKLLGWMLPALVATAARAADRPVVAVSVVPQAFFVEKIAGPLVDVHVLVPPGANEASFEPTMRQMQAVSAAALYVKVGHPRFLFEQAWLARLAAANPSMHIVDGSQGAPADEDPHVWVSPACVRVLARNLETALAFLLPDHAARLAANRAAFEREIDTLDAEIRRKLAPFAGRKFLVVHPAWSRFGKEMGLEQIAIAEEAKEPSARQLAERLDQARAAGIRTVFVQPQVSRKEAELIAAQLGARIVVLDPLERDWLSNLRRVADALAESFQP